MSSGSVLVKNGTSQPNTRLLLDTEYPPSVEDSKFPILDENLIPATRRNSISIYLSSTQQLCAVCERFGLSLSNMLQAVWGLVVRCYTGNDSVRFGLLSFAGGRPSNNVKSGDRSQRISANIFVVNETLSATDTIAATLERWKYEGVFPKACGRGVRPDVSKENPEQYLDSIFVEQVYEQVDVPFTADYDAALSSKAIIIETFRSTSDCILLNLKYSSQRLSDVAAANIANTFHNMVNCVLADPLQRIAELQVASAQDYQQITTWNATIVERCDACIHQFIEKHASQSPEQPAIHSHDGLLTYGQLDRLSTQIAGKLIEFGVGPEVLVPICVEKSLWAVIAMTAILKAGGAFVPLDPSHPVDRLTSIIHRTRASLVVTSTSQSGLFAKLAIRTYIVGQVLIDSLDTTDGLRSKTPVQPDNVAFVLFTSGSTGQPKGIVQEHGSVCTNSLVHGEALGLNSESRVLQFAAYTFDVSMMDIFTTLIMGGCVCIPSEYDRVNDITTFINATQVNWALLTPSFSNLIEPDNVPSLATLALGGEAVTRENIRRWANKVVLLNCYGPAECGACIVSAKRIDGEARPDTIGRRLPGAQCWLTDPSDHNRLSPIGSIGELCVEGPTLARGYLDDPTLTEAQFISDPAWLSGVSHRRQRIYKTGDLLRQNSNGSFQFIGRIDSQIKIRGQRVELGEVEHRLSSHSAVASCVVASPKSGPYHKCLVGVVQPRESHSKLLPRSSSDIPPSTTLEVLRPQQIQFDTSQLSQHLQEQLPPYMIPNIWILVKEIPLSTSAKIDRKKVIVWLTGLDREVNISQGCNGLDIASGAQNLLAPHEVTAIDISTKVASILAEGNRQFRFAAEHGDLNLTDVGLDSIQAISLAMSIRQSHGVKLGIEHLTHKDTTIRTVANQVDQLKHGAHHATINHVDISREWRSLLQQLTDRALVQRPRGLTLLVTGGTGFLGIQILCNLLHRRDVYKVIVLIRAESAVAGLNRIVEAASSAGWWSESLRPRLEIWLGDLERSKLGLRSSHWDQMLGRSKDDNLDAIIHSGASVRWNADFETLKAVNVGSTFELLDALIQSRNPPKFVYVSGGQALQPYDESDEQILEHAARGNGYCQTKTLSEILVRSVMRDDRYAANISIVKPSYIIGSPERGVANKSDFLWRLVGSCIDIHAYNAEDEGTWLYISDVDHVASVVVSCSTNSTRGVTKILTRLRVKEFWAILTGYFGYDIQPLDQTTWLHQMRMDIEKKRQTHQLWPLLDTLEDGKGVIGVGDTTGDHDDEEPDRAILAIQKNVEYLISIKCFPQPPAGFAVR